MHQLAALKHVMTKWTEPELTYGFASLPFPDRSLAPIARALGATRDPAHKRSASSAGPNPCTASKREPMGQPALPIEFTQMAIWLWVKIKITRGQVLILGSLFQGKPLWGYPIWDPQPYTDTHVYNAKDFRRQRHDGERAQLHPSPSRQGCAHVSTTRHVYSCSKGWLSPLNMRGQWRTANSKEVPFILWMDEFLHHTRNPAMIRFPCKCQQIMVSKWCGRNFDRMILMILIAQNCSNGMVRQGAKLSWDLIYHTKYCRKWQRVNVSKPVEAMASKGYNSSLTSISPCRPSGIACIIDICIANLMLDNQRQSRLPPSGTGMLVRALGVNTHPGHHIALMKTSAEHPDSSDQTSATLQVRYCESLLPTECLGGEGIGYRRNMIVHNIYIYMHCRKALSCGTAFLP